MLLGSTCLAAPAPAETEHPDQVEIRLEGLQQELVEPVLNSLTLHQQNSHDRLNGGRIALLHRRAAEEIDAALQALGYYGTTVQSALDRDEGRWVARYTITPGDRVHVDDVAIGLRGAGSEDPVVAQAIGAFPLKTGDPLIHEQYENGKRRLSRTLAERGYFDARLVRSEIRVDRAAELADIVIDFDTGNRYRFGVVEFVDNPLQPGFIQGYVPFSAGEPYSSDTLLQLRDRLVASHYFNDAVVDPDIERARANQERRVPVTVRLSPRKRQRYSIGAGFGTDTGPRGRVGWEHRYLNTSGHHLKTELSASAIRSGLGVSYSIPFGDPMTDQWVLSASARDEDTDSRENRTLSFSAGRSTVRWGWDELASLTYLIEDFKPGEERSRTSTLFYPGLRWSRLWSDNPVYAHHGGRLEVSVRGAAEELISDVSFMQLKLAGKYIRGLGERGRFIVRGEFGTTSVSNFDNLPTSLRFFAGGDNSVRGFDYEELGPRNEDGDVLGGKHLVVGSVEYEHRIFGDWSVAAFTDFGNAYDDFSGDLAYSVGAGVRWLSPIGPVRLDLAVPISESDSSFRLHISIGPDL